MNQRSNKAAIIWNVQEPDDPYDIKKSMIAKLPDHPSKPMGQYLEVVCLLQSAQIERLSDFLTQLKAKYRQMERKELDRHSYEVQIKELAQKTVAYNTLKAQNDRLRDFIRRQAQQLQEFQKSKLNSMSLQALQAKYERSLNELNISRQQKQRLQIAITKLNYEVTEWKGKWQRSELEKSSQKSQFQVQIRDKIAIQVRSINQKANQRNQKLQIQIRQLKQYIQSKNQEISSLSSQRDQFIREIRLLQEKNKSRGNVQESLNEKNKEIQRLNSIIAQRSAKLEQAMGSMQKIGGQNRILEQRYYSLQKQNENLLIKVRESEYLAKNRSEFDKYEDKIAMMSMEIERLNGLNITKGRQNAQLSAELQRSRLQLMKIISIKEQAERQRDRLKQLQNDTHMKATYQNRIALLSQQVQRANMQLRIKSQQYFSLSERFKNLEAASSQINAFNTQNNRLKLQLQASRTQLWNYKNITENQIKSLKNEHLKLLKQLQQIQGSHFQRQKFKTQCDRLRAELDRIRSESIMIKRGAEQQRANNSRYLSQRSKLIEANNKLAEDNIKLSQDNKRFSEEIRSIRVQIVQINRQREELIFHINQSQSKQDTIRALHEELQSRRQRNEHLQATMQKIYGQIDRLHALLSSKTAEHLKISKEYAQLQQRYKFIDAKINNTVGEKDFYEKQISRYKNQLQNLSRFTSDAKRQIENKNSQFSLEKERYERLIIQNQKLISEHVKQKETLQRKLIDLQRQLALRVPQEQQLKREQLKIRDQLRMKESLIIQLQTTIRQKQSYFRQGQDRSKQFESRISEWQNRLRQAERSIIICEQQKQQVLQENKRWVQQKQRLNKQLLRVSQDLKRANQQNMKINSELTRVTQQNSKFKLEIFRFNDQLAKQGDITLKIRREEESKVRQKWDALNQENLKLRMKVDQLSSLERIRSNEDQLKGQLLRAEQSLKHQKMQAQNLRMQMRRCEQLINRQNAQIQSLKQSTKEYQLKIVHIEATNTKHFQERLKQQSFRLQDQLRDTELRLQQKQSLIVSMQRNINQLEVQLRRLIEKDRQSLNNLDQYQNKISILSVELQRVNTIIKDKTLECRQKDLVIEKSQAQIRELKQSKAIDNCQKQRMEIASLNIKIQELQNINMHTTAERDELFRLCHQLQTKHEQQIIRTKEESRRFGQQVGILRRKEQTYIAKIRELEENLSRPQQDPFLRKKLNELQAVLLSRTRQIQELKNQIANLQTEVQQMENMLHQEKEKRERTSRQQIRILNTKIHQYSILINGKDLDIIAWQNKYTGLYSAYEQLYLNFNITKSQYQVTINSLRVYQQKFLQLQQDFSSISESYRVSRNQVERLKAQNRELRLQIERGGDLYQKNLLLSKEIDRLNEINKSMKIEIQQIRIRLTDNVSLSKRIEEHMALFVVLFAQIQALRSRLVHSQEECESVRRNSLVPLRVDRSERRI